MSKRNLTVLAAAVVVVVIAALWLRRPAPPVEAPAPTPAVVPPAPTPPVVPEEVPPTPEPEPVVPVAPPEPEAVAPPHEHEVYVPGTGIAPEDVVTVRADRVLAIVNGVSITLKDLSPSGEGVGAEESMTREEYESRLNRAIETELTLQEARKQGVELSSDQQDNLQQIRDRHAADIQHYRDQGMMWTSVTRQQIDFEAKQVTARLLQQNLLTKAGAPPLYPTQADIDKYYEVNIAQYGELPTDPAERDAAWSKISFEILKKLSPQFQEQYLRWLKEYMDQLKAQANLIINEPSP